MSFLKLCVAGSLVGTLVGAPTVAAGQERTVSDAATSGIGRLEVTGGVSLSTRAPSQGTTQSVSIVAIPPTKYGLSVEWGPDNAFAGNMIKEASGQTATGVPIHLNETTYDDTYGRMSQFKVGFSVRTASRAEATANFIYSRSGSETVDVGTLGGTNLPVNFSSLDFWGIEGGQRFFFSRAIVQPFAGYLAGVNRYGDVTALFEGQDANLIPGLAAQDGKVFEKSWAFSAGPTGGVLVDVGRIALMAELQFRYMGGLSDVDWLVEEGLRDINDESSRWSLPLSFGVRFKF
jgi:hypothetical protein